MEFRQLIFTIMLVAPPRFGPAVQRDETWDCAQTALYVLLSLEESSCDPQALSQVLPPHPDGVSIVQLSEASSKLGVPLRTVRLRARDGTRVGAFIAFAHDEGKPYGHFLVVRPIGRTYLQLIDPPHVEVVPIERMFPEPNSVVVALIRQRSDLRTIVGWTLLGIGILLVSAISVRLLRQRRLSRGPRLPLSRMADKPIDAAERMAGRSPPAFRQG